MASNRNEPRVQDVGVVKLKLGKALNMPSRRMLRDLERMARLCAVARNAAISAWRRWREDHPDWHPELTTSRNGRRYPLNHPLPPQRKAEDGTVTGGMFDVGNHAGISGQTWLYHACRDTSSEVAGTICSCLASEVWSGLTAKLPYNHAGTARYRWEGILAHEVSQTSYTIDRSTIPVPNSGLVLAVAETDEEEDDDTESTPDLVLSPGAAGKGLRDRLRTLAGSGAAVALPLWSQGSGRRETHLICRIETRQLPDGLRKILRRLARGEPGWKIADSKLVFDAAPPHVQRRGHPGDWFLHLTYRMPPVSMALDQQHPALLMGQDATEPSPWILIDTATGQKRYLALPRVVELEYRRLVARRKNLRARSRLGVGRGHGQREFYAGVVPATRKARDLFTAYWRQMASDVARQCRLWNCGTLILVEPPLGLRGQSWFARRPVPLPLDWTLLAGRLTHRCRRSGIAFAVTPLKEARQQWPQFIDGQDTLRWQRCHLTSGAALDERRIQNP